MEVFTRWASACWSCILTPVTPTRVFLFIDDTIYHGLDDHVHPAHLDRFIQLRVLDNFFDRTIASLNSSSGFCSSSFASESFFFLSKHYAAVKIDVENIFARQVSIIPPLPLTRRFLAHQDGQSDELFNRKARLEYYSADIPMANSS